MLRIAFIHNAITPYRAPLFEELAAEFPEMQFLIVPVNDLGVQPLRDKTRVHIFRGKFYFGSSLVYPAGLYSTLINNRFDVILSTDLGLIATWIAFIATRKLGAPFVLWSEEWMWSRHPRRVLTRIWEKHILGHTDGVVAFGEKVESFVINNGVKRDRVVRALNSIEPTVVRSDDVNNFVNRYRQAIGLCDFVVLFLGRLVKQKGIHVLVEAFHRFLEIRGVNAALLIAGEGEFENQLRRMVAIKGEHFSKRVFFTGHGVSGAEKDALFRIANVFVYPSVSTLRVGFDAWGLAVNEAAMHHLSLIVSDRVGATDLVTGENGMVVESGDAESLALALTEIYQSDWRKMGNNSFEHLKKSTEEYNPVRAISRLLSNLMRLS